MAKKYLDLTGLQKFAASILGKFALKNHNHDTAYAAKSHTHTTSQVGGLDSALAGKADKVHTHDDRYYTEAEANSKFSPIGGSASLGKLAATVTLGDGSAASIVQNSGQYHQKIDILDDAEAGTATFVFSQSTDNGANFTKLMSIKDDGAVVANKFAGSLSGNASSASSVPWGGVTGKPSSFAPSAHNHNDLYYTESEIDSKLSGKANASHTHDDRYYTETEMNSKLDAKADVGHTHTIDTSLSSTSTNPVQNKVINSALAGKVPTTRTVNGKPLTSNISLTAADVGADASGAANSALTSAKSYTDGKVANLLNNSTEAVDSIMELADAMKTNKDAIDSLNSIAASKANASDLNAHKGDTTSHITSTERNNWNSAKTHAGTAHAPANAEANQNAFSNVTVGSTVISADTKTDNLTLAGSNVTLTPDATNDKITIGLTKANVTSALGYTPPTTNTTYGVGTASTLGLTKLYTGTGSATDGTMTQSAITNALGGKANSSHNHSADNITSGVLPIARGGTGATSADGIRGAIGINPIAAGGTGAAYTATVPGITSLVAGVSFTMVPNVVSTAVSPTLNVNNLGAKAIRQRLSNGTQSTATGAAANWLAAGKPVNVMYDGAFWVVDFVRPNMTSAYGTLPVANGGVPSCTTSDNGKFLRVENGVPTWVTIPSAEGVKF